MLPLIPKDLLDELNQRFSNQSPQLGETHQEVIESMEDLRSVDVDILTIGQYLQPTPKHLPIDEFITPERFAEYKELGLKMGFKYVESGPLVRSSYRAEKHLF